MDDPNIMRSGDDVRAEGAEPRYMALWCLENVDSEAAGVQALEYLNWHSAHGNVSMQ